MSTMMSHFKVQFVGNFYFIYIFFGFLVWQIQSWGGIKLSTICFFFWNMNIKIEMNFVYFHIRNLMYLLFDIVDWWWLTPPDIPWVFYRGKVYVSKSRRFRYFSNNLLAWSRIQKQIQRLKSLSWAWS